MCGIIGIIGGQSVSNLFSALTVEPASNYETPDQTIATETMLSYPKTVQCRLDTYLQGTLQSKRPACWFKD